jgi:hypothetical protein
MRKIYLDNCCLNRPFLGRVGMAYFIRQFETGIGNYTKEKYEIEDYTMEEIQELLEIVQK